jgi:hypothetical protein
MPDEDGFPTDDEIANQMFGPCKGCGHMEDLRGCKVHPEAWLEGGCVFWVFTPAPGERNCIDCLKMIDRFEPVRWYGSVMVLS